MKDNFFEPSTLLAQLLNIIDSSNASIDVCVYRIEKGAILNKIIQKSKEGVIVRIITDYSFKPFYIYQNIENINVYLYNSKNNILHKKYIIIDGVNVVLTSSNFTCLEKKYLSNSAISSKDKIIVNDVKLDFNSLLSKSNQINFPIEYQLRRRGHQYLSVASVFIKKYYSEIVFTSILLLIGFVLV